MANEHEVSSQWYAADAYPPPPVTESGSWLDAYTLAAQRTAGLPGNWIGFLFEAVRGQGVMVTGLVVTSAKTRGPNKGEPNFRKGDQSTKRRVFVSIADADKARTDLLAVEAA